MDAIFTKTDKDITKVKHNKLWFKRATEDFGALEAKVMGVYGAMVRGLSKGDALIKYGLIEKEYEEGYSKVFGAND